MSATSNIPPDNGVRQLTLANPDDPDLRNIAMVGDTYTILLSGEDTDAPHAFRNATDNPVRLLGTVSQSPSRNEERGEALTEASWSSSGRQPVPSP